MRLMHTAARLLLARTPLGLWPVRVRHGIAAGARWTFFPWTSYWRGTHEPKIQSVLLSLGHGDIRGWSCWDLGAHFGLYSIGLARRVGSTGEVAAFEPNPLSFVRLQHHAARNHLSWLKLYRAAVSDQPGSVELYTYGDLATTTTHLPYEGETRSAAVGAIRVARLRLDDLVQSGELRPPRFVKIDVEGHGHHALRGMERTLAGARPIILTAFHSPQERDGMFALLSPLGYQWREIGGANSAPSPAPTGDYLFTPPA